MKGLPQAKRSVAWRASHLAIVAAVAAVAMPSWAPADWIPTTVDGSNYSNPSNWTGGVINDAITGSAFDPSPTGANQGNNDHYNIVFDADRSTTGDFRLDYTNTFDWSFFLRHAGGSTKTLTLNGNLFVNATKPGNPDDNRFIKFGESGDIDINIGSQTRLFTVTPGYRNNDGEFFIHQGAITGTGGIVKDGSGRLALEGGTDTFAGPLVVRSGKVEVNNNVTTDTIFAGFNGRLQIRDSDKLSDTATLTMSGGVLHMDNQNGSETLGKLDLIAGRNVIGWKGGDGNNAGTITLGDFSRDNYATLLMGNKQERRDQPAQIKLLGTDYKVVVTNSSSVTSQLLGGGGADGTSTKSILPWATFTSNIEGGDRQPEIKRELGQSNGLQPEQFTPNAGFLTYDATNGFRALNRTTEYFQNDQYTDEASWGATDNVRVTSTRAVANGGNGNYAIILTADRTVNSLFWDRPINDGGTGDSIVNLGGNTLTITSGGIAVSGGGYTAFQNGTVNFGSADVYTSVHGAVQFSSNSSIVGTGNIIVAGNNTIIESNNSGWSGDVIVQGEFGLQSKQAISPINDIYIEGNRMAGKKDGSIGRVNINYGGGDSNAANAGNLTANGWLKFGNVNDNRKLKLGAVATNLDSGVYASKTTLAVGNGATVAIGGAGAGLYGDSRAGLFTIGHQDNSEAAGTEVGRVLFEAGSKLALDFFSAELFDQMAFMGAANSGWEVDFSGGTIEVSFLDGYVPDVGASWQVFYAINNTDSTGFGTFAKGATINGVDGTLSPEAFIVGTGAASGYSFDLSTSGLLSVVAVPEPSSLAVLALALFGMGARVRRR